VPGVTISGRITAQASVLRIGGRAAAHGTLRLGAHMTLDGILGGKRVQLAGAEPQAVNAQMARLDYRER
jgi:hypothetical protein